MHPTGQNYPTRRTLTRRTLLFCFLSIPVGQVTLASQCGDRYRSALEVINISPTSQSAVPQNYSYQLWVNGRVRVLINPGSGSYHGFLQSGANIHDLKTILFTRLDASRSNDLPIFVAASQASGRRETLSVFGPDGNKYMPSTVNFVRTLFDQKRGAWRHLGDVISPLGYQGYKLKAHNAGSGKRPGQRPGKPGENLFSVLNDPEYQLQATDSDNRFMPTLSWRLGTDNNSVTLVDDSANVSEKLETLASGTGLLLAKPHSEKQTSQPVLTANEIGRLAYRSGTRQLHLVYPSTTDSATKNAHLALVKNKYAGLVSFAGNNDCLPISPTNSPDTPTLKQSSDLPHSR